MIIIISNKKELSSYIIFGRITLTQQKVKRVLVHYSFILWTHFHSSRPLISRGKRKERRKKRGRMAKWGSSSISLFLSVWEPDTYHAIPCHTIHSGPQEYNCSSGYQEREATHLCENNVTRSLPAISAALYSYSSFPFVLFASGPDPLPLFLYHSSFLQQFSFRPLIFSHPSYFTTSLFLSLSFSPNNTTRLV